MAWGGGGRAPPPPPKKKQKKRTLVTWTEVNGHLPPNALCNYFSTALSVRTIRRVSPASVRPIHSPAATMSKYYDIDAILTDAQVAIPCSPPLSLIAPS